MMEALRFLDEPINLIFVKTPAMPGLRMVVFSILLMVMIIYRQRGLMGNKEFSWEMFQNAFVKKSKKGGSHARTP